MIKGARFSLMPVRVLLASGGFGLHQRGILSEGSTSTTPTETVASLTQADTLSGAPWREQPKSGLPTIRSDGSKTQSPVKKPSGAGSPVRGRK